MMSARTNLTILANAFVSTHSIGGGDRFIMEVSPTLAKATPTTIITPKVGYHHWQRLTRIILVSRKFNILKPTIFDDRDHPVAIMLAYIIRSIETISLLRKNPPNRLVTASQLLPDVAPAYLLKRIHPRLRWVARIYHLIPHPSQRVGNPLVNTVVYLLQGLLILLLKSADLIVADNPQTANELKKRGYPQDKLEMLPSGINYQAITNHKPIRKWSFDAAYIGRLDPHRGIFDLPLIWKTVTEKLPTAKLAIVGYGPANTTERLKGKFRELKLNNNVSFLGFLPHEEGKEHPLYDLLKSVKILMLPIHEGGWPLTVAEALSAGVPAVIYNLPNLGTTFPKGILTAPLKDAQAFAKQTLALLNDEERRNRLGKEAQAEARRHDVQQVASRFTKLVLG